jgi:hypothetical protein
MWLPREVLAAIFCHLSNRELYAALRVNRDWAAAALPLIWRRPWERNLLSLPQARREVYAPFVAEIYVYGYHPTRLFRTAFPRLQTLVVPMRVIVPHAARFCRFLESCVGRGGMSSASLSTGGSSSEASSASRLRIFRATDYGYMAALLPPDVFAALARRRGLREFSTVGQLDRRAVLQTLGVCDDDIDRISDDEGSGKGGYDIANTAESAAVVRHSMPTLFPDIEVFKAAASSHHPLLIVLQNLPTASLAELDLTIAVADMGPLLPAVARFTSLQSLTLTCCGEPLPCQAITVLGSLRQLRQLHLNGSGSFGAISDEVLLNVLARKPLLADLKIERASLLLTPAVLPRIGHACRKLQRLELGITIDLRTLEPHSAPVFPLLTYIRGYGLPNHEEIKA